MVYYSRMFKRLLTWFQTSVGYLWLVVLAVYFSVLAGQAMYRNYESQQVSNGLKQELADAQLERDRLSALVVYYTTDSFREKELRRSLLLKMPDEKVYALPESAIGRQVEQEQAVRRQLADPRTSQPTWRQWIEYLLGSNVRG